MNKQECHTKNKGTESLPKFKAEDFWQWLVDAIKQHQVTVNQSNSIVHGVELGLLVCIPKALDEFLLAQAQQMGIENSNIIPIEQRINLTKAIKKCEKLVRNQQGSRIHTYYMGKWEDRHVISGVVIKPSDLFRDSMTLPINLALMIDPIGTV